CVQLRSHIASDLVGSKIAILQTGPPKGAECRLQSRRCLRRHYAGPQTAPHAEPALTGVVERLGAPHHVRHPDVRKDARLDTGESVLQYSRDFIHALFGSANAKPPAKDAGVTREPAAPKRIADDGDRMRAGRSVVIGSQRSSEGRPDSEQWKRISGNPLRVEFFRLIGKASKRHIALRLISHAEQIGDGSA